MKICVSCKKEMRCTKTGRTAVWDRNHVYRGDEYTCPDCGAKFLVCNAQPYHDESALRMASDEPIDMTGSQEKPDCYKCVHRRPIPGNTHSECLNTNAFAVGQPHE